MADKPEDAADKPKGKAREKGEKGAGERGWREEDGGGKGRNDKQRDQRWTGEQRWANDNYSYDDWWDPLFFLTFIQTLTLANFLQTLRGLFSALSKPNFASKYSFE